MTLKSREVLQRGFDKSDSWAIINNIKLNKNKCQILHLGWRNLGYTYSLGDERLESSLMERDLGVLVEGQLKSIVCSGSQEYPGVYHAQCH